MNRSSSNPRGLIMIQIDGLSKAQLEKALTENNMPFLKRLLEKERYRLFPYYSGLPSTTPAVQGEIFYGVKQAVPGFFFFDKQTQKIFRMFDADAVLEMEKRLAAQGKGLLEGGSSYSNIYSGGAKEAHFCAGSLGWNYIWKDLKPLSAVPLLFTHFLAVVRMVFLTSWELILAKMDFIYGLLKREDPIIEFKFVPIRVLLCILLRELITLGAKIDAARGLPIIHLNFIGYDEQAHRRGPGTQTACWALKGIDRAIKKIYLAAAHSSRRNYDVWVYSDHGQEATIPYEGFYGESVERAVKRVFQDLFLQEKSPLSNDSNLKKKFSDKGIQLQRGRYLGKWFEKVWPLNYDSGTASSSDVIVAAMGPIGSVHILKNLSLDDKYRFAREMVASAKIPLVLMPQENGTVRAWNKDGEFMLPEQAREILGKDHPYFDEVTKDLISLCYHPNAGAFIISGWKLNGKPYSFPFENGAHAGPGKEETNAFALLPVDTLTLPGTRSYLRTEDLRKTALAILAQQHF